MQVLRNQGREIPAVHWSNPEQQIVFTHPGPGQRRVRELNSSTNLSTFVFAHLSPSNVEGMVVLSHSLSLPVMTVWDVMLCHHHTPHYKPRERGFKSTVTMLPVFQRGLMLDPELLT